MVLVFYSATCCDEITTGCSNVEDIHSYKSQNEIEGVMCTAGWYI
jgi:hypothetical protein